MQNRKQVRRKDVGRRNNRQVLNLKPGEDITDWYLHPRKGWKRDRLRTRRMNQANRERLSVFRQSLKAKEAK